MRMPFREEVWRCPGVVNSWVLIFCQEVLSAPHTPTCTQYYFWFSQFYCSCWDMHTSLRDLLRNTELVRGGTESQTLQFAGVHKLPFNLPTLKDFHFLESKYVITGWKNLPYTQPPLNLPFLPRLSKEPEKEKRETPHSKELCREEFRPRAWGLFCYKKCNPAQGVRSQEQTNQPTWTSLKCFKKPVLGVSQYSNLKLSTSVSYFRS